MAIPWFYIEKKERRESIITLNPQQTKQIRKVLKLRLGEKIVLVDGQGTNYSAEVASLEKSGVKAKIKEAFLIKDEFQTINLIMGVPKLVKLDEIISRCTQLGVKSFLLFNAERSIKVKKAPEKKLKRWKNIAIEAMELSRRSFLPKIDFFRNIEDIFKELKDENSYKYIAHISGQKSLFDLFEELLRGKALPIYIMIGPEGGWTEKELKLAKNEGFQPITLNWYNLSTQTASYYLVSIIDFIIKNKTCFANF